MDGRDECSRFRPFCLLQYTSGICKQSLAKASRLLFLYISGYNIEEGYREGSKKKIVTILISNIDNTSHEEETSNNRRKTKSLHCPQLDHHDADRLAGHKAWRTAQTTTRYKRPLISIS
jgi:hypothetical protein